MSASQVLKCRKVFSQSQIGIQDASDWVSLIVATTSGARLSLRHYELNLSPGEVYARKRSGPEIIVFVLASHTTLKFHIDAESAKMQPDGSYMVRKKGKHFCDPFQT